MKIILLDELEQGGNTRVKKAEEIIRTLPMDYPGRNTWLFQYGQSEEAKILRADTNPSVDYNIMWTRCGTGSLNRPALADEQVKRIMEIVYENQQVSN